MSKKTDSKKQAGVKPLGDRVLVKPIEEKETERKSEAGIIIPESGGEEAAKRGEVVAVGPGGKNKEGEITPVELKEGDKVLFKEFAGDKVRVDNEDYYIVSETGVLAKFD